MGTGIRAKLIGLAATATVVAAGLAPGTPPTVGAAATSSTYTLTEGLKLTTTRYPKDADDLPQEIRLLTVTPVKGPHVDIAQADRTFGARTPTSDITRAAGAIVGVNGDFMTDWEAPLHATMIDGEIWTSGYGGNAFAMTSNGRRAWIGRPKLVSSLRALRARSDIRPIVLSAWNAQLPQGGETAAYTQRGGSAVPPPGDTSPSSGDPAWCEARLTPVPGSHPEWSDAEKASITRRYRVVAQPEPCPKKPLPIGDDRRNVVIASRAAFDGGRAIMQLTQGDVVRISWGFRGWPGAIDVLGGNPMLVDNGVNVGPPDYSGAPHILYYNPRTAVGITAGCADKLSSTRCKVLILTNDGRQTDDNWSRGWKMPALANEMIKRGSLFAMNLDGGGSTTMWAADRSASYCQTNTSPDGCLVNRPAYSSSERDVIQALVVLPGDDPGTPKSLR
jgi:hypothetical protein